MKIRRGGTYENTRSEEVSDWDIISAHIKSLTGRNCGPSKLFGLGHFADFSTLRHAWIANTEFNIVLDRTDFGHTVGEVELVAQVPAQDGNEAQMALKTMDYRLVEFLQLYAWAFTTGKPVGKLSAYFAHDALKRS